MPSTDVQLLDRGNVLAPDRVVGRLDQLDHGRRDPELEVLGCLPQTVELGKVLGTELWASTSSEAIEFFLRTSCQVSAMSPSKRVER